MAATLAQLRTRAQRLADMENSQFVANAEWLDYINEGLSELYDIVIGKNDDWFVTTQSIALVAGTAAYAVNAAFYKERGVDLVSGSTSYTLRPFMFRERNAAQGLAGALLEEPYQYQIVGANIRFIPTPAAAGTATLWYIPQITQLSADGDTVSTTLPLGWERYIVLYAALRALQKEESDASALMTELAATQRKIEKAASGRSAGDPKRVVDVRNTRGGWGW